MNQSVEPPGKSEPVQYEDSAEPEYDNRHIRFLEAMWGDGYLSPGGPEEVRRIVEGIDFASKTVLDVGCGSGGITLFLAGEFSPRKITGFDVEEPVIEKARERSEARKMADRVEFVKGRPGPLPFPVDSFDIVFSKDALVHIDDKETLFREFHRVLKPGGVFAGSDWLTSHDGAPSAAMKTYLEAEGLSFGMASAGRYKAALKEAGFEDVVLVNRNPWYRVEAREELARLEGPLFEKVVAQVGEEFVDKNIKIWTEMIKVLDTGEHRPTHLRAKRPG